MIAKSIISLQHLLSVDIATLIFSTARLTGHIIVVIAKSIISLQHFLSVDIATDIYHCQIDGTHYSCDNEKITLLQHLLSVVS